MPEKNYSDYIIYVDESGDHSLGLADKEYPVFVLAFCIFKKESYTHSAVRKLKKFKFKHFGHDMVVLHENEIRREKGWFKALKPKEYKLKFIDELTQIIKKEDFTIVSTVIRKDKLQNRQKSPYDIALKKCIELTYEFLKLKNQHKSKTTIVVEQRGKKEDQELELEFRRICDSNNFENKTLPFDIVLANKMSNSAGLQLADLVARPIGLSVIKPEQINRAYEIIKTKVYNAGLKVYP
jgi:hypothetical protein